jgi:hypothetical protein
VRDAKAQYVFALARDQKSAFPPANLTYLLGQSAQKTYCRIDHI